MIILLVGFSSEIRAQASFLGKDKTWINDNLESGWTFIGKGKSQNGSLFLSYKRNSEEMVFYFSNEKECNEIIVVTSIAKKEEYIKYYDSQYVRTRELRWVSEKDNALIEMNLSQKDKGILGIVFKLSL